MSYYDENGYFAGVISIAYDVEEIYQIVRETKVFEDGFSFILNSSGNVILSAKKDGIIAAKETDFDLRKMPNPSLAQTVQKMAAGESDVRRS